ncbi:hypothetical protein [Leeuwenhoekiella parthenopeia]|uniref:Uncharacterized protein n=1 Tax=Leeuwenhoekiella parthenopeia TaxID=2890320 RepID=A0ABS8GNL5_9FLAO|nr:hypothetical protein [Leeuwenhoekiella parthenopeia]MCC4211587.1 hypothetical protein [Leeuwenhoekiella parthenopeia]
MDIQISTERLDLILGNHALIAMNIFELLAFISGLAYWKKFTGSPIIVFIIFLGYNFFNEMIAAAINVTGILNRTTVFYNLRYLFYFSAIYWIYYKYLKYQLYKQTVVVLYFTWLITLFYFVLTSNFVIQKPVFSAVTGDFFLIIIILFYLIETIKNADLSRIQDLPLIYISVGLLISTVIQLPVSIINYKGWLNLTEVSNSLNTFYSIIRNTSFWSYSLMYGIFAFGFYKAKPQEVKS